LIVLQLPAIQTLAKIVPIAILYTIRTTFALAMEPTMEGIALYRILSAIPIHAKMQGFVTGTRTGMGTSNAGAL